MANEAPWKLGPHRQDYPAAADYLSLALGEQQPRHVVEELSSPQLLRRKAKDLRRVRRGQRLSPVLLVRGTDGAEVPLTGADGYPRIRASYHLDEDADAPCALAARASLGRRLRPGPRARLSNQ